MRRKKPPSLELTSAMSHISLWGKGDRKPPVVAFSLICDAESKTNTISLASILILFA